MSEMHKNRVMQLRTLMAAKSWDAVIITGTDPHNSEYPADRWKQVEWLSGFTGEAGDLVITQDHAGLWTDSRYFIQALSQLDGSGIELHKTRQPDSVDIPHWLASYFDKDEVVVAVDGFCQSLEAVQSLESCFKKSGCTLRLCSQPDLLDIFWQDRPAIPQSPIITLDEEEVGESRIQRLTRIRKYLMCTDGCDAMLLSSLDEIAWLLNVRGSDIIYNPYVISYLLVTMDDVTWYVKKGPVEQGSDTADSFDELLSDGVSVCNYQDLGFGLAGYRSNSEGGKIFVDPSSLNFEVYRLIKCTFPDEDILTGESPVALWKAIKNPVELAGFREAFLVDGVALEKFLYWLETSLEDGQEITEWDASVKLTSLRSMIEGYRGDSFENISAWGPDAALPHYVTREDNPVIIEPEGLYLIDSGGHYLFGTTDTTRTVPVGECTDLEKEDYTLVLKGMIGLSRAQFPKGTCGCHIDLLARQPLWQSKRNFGHGTGHGIGFFSGVHEGPQAIRQNLLGQAILPGMVTSNEPGIYREGMHGIRHENVILCVEDQTNEFGQWLKFETLTLCHIDTGAIISDLLDDEELDWLNDYNEHVYQTLAPYLPTVVKDWLRRKTMPLSD